MNRRYLAAIAALALALACLAVLLSGSAVQAAEDGDSTVVEEQGTREAANNQQDNGNPNTGRSEIDVTTVESTQASDPGLTGLAERFLRLEGWLLGKRYVDHWNV